VQKNFVIASPCDDDAFRIRPQGHANRIESANHFLPGFDILSILYAQIHGDHKHTAASVETMVLRITDGEEFCHSVR
jgi:hypothetical protein